MGLEERKEASSVSTCSCLGLGDPGRRGSILAAHLALLGKDLLGEPVFNGSSHALGSVQGASEET